MEIYNYHTHTFRCGHAVGNDEDYVQTAIAAGFKVLGFSDHGPYPDYPMKNIHMNYDQLPDYIASITSLKEKYRDQIKVGLGLEIEYFHNDEYLRQLKQQLDYLILGQHFAAPDGSGFYFRNNSDEEIVVYGENVCAGLRSGLFAYLCHPDVFLVDQEEFTDTCAEVSRQIIETAVVTNTPLELNIHGVRRGKKPYKQGLRFAYPHYEFWKVAAEYPVKVVVGVDAHDPADLLKNEDYETALKELEGLELNIIHEDILSKDWK